MKKIIFSALFASFGLGATAQTGGVTGTNVVANVSGTTSRVSTNEEIRALANRLELNEYGYIRLRDLSKARNEQITEINTMYSNDPALRQSKLNEVNKEFEAGLAQAITTKQFTAYQQFMGRTPGATGAGFEAGGYGGRSLEGGATSPASTVTPNTNTPTNTNSPNNGSMKDKPKK